MPTVAIQVALLWLIVGSATSFRLQQFDAATASSLGALGSSDRNNLQLRHHSVPISQIPSANSSLVRSHEDDCDCFNCLLPKFTCGQFGQCSEYDGQCKCPAGWGGQDCLIPQCGSLADGHERPLRRDTDHCQCSDGWGGINCNMCLSDEACGKFPLVSVPDDDVGNPSMVCYAGGDAVLENHQMCNVTNPKILDELKGQIPQVTFSCNTATNTCLFQFWVDERESFYCGLDTCQVDVKHTHNSDDLQYTCQNLYCSCVPDRMLCGESGSLDIGDFLKEDIKGPAKFVCSTGAGCRFEEKAMNGLITDFFGDPYITLRCHSGECLATTMVPGYIRPRKPDNKLQIALSAAAGGLIFLLTFAGLWYVGRTNGGGGSIRLPEAENARLMADHVPTSLQFTDISYSIGNRYILDKITGTVKSGELLAIMGASGAGKSTFLDILARKNKRGNVSGIVSVNGHHVSDADFKNVMGFVDQEDTLMSTLTVYETVLYSALLRLPRKMSLEAKKYRTMETLQELGLIHIKNARIGSSGRRSISGGEKRRVSIACELVTSPSILFLDEPTSGLDAFNALNVVECLVSLAKNYGRTVVFTIHQPRSNIVALFHRLIVLAEGKMVYSGSFAKCHEYFSNIGRPCPPGFNIADYFIDITMEKHEHVSSDNSSVISIDDNDPRADEERALVSPLREDETELRTRPNSVKSRASSIKSRTSQLFNALTLTSSGANSSIPISEHVDGLAKSYLMSEIAAETKAEIANVRAQSNDDTISLTTQASMIRGHQRASWATQFRILSGRAFKNMYRDPALLAAHYVASLVVAVVCGLFFHDVADDIGGFQNRLGLFFFTLALFGFSCLSSLALFANERILFIRERSNGYYSTFTYFTSKVMFDIVPLRLVPPLMYGGIVYPLVGLVPTVVAFWKFMLTLVLFNLTTASVVFTISVAFASTSVATLVGTMTMLFNLLFAGLLINADSVMPALKWLHSASFFHAAFEALAVNELRTLQLKQYKYGIEIDVPSAAILQTFGLKALAFWWPDIATLAIVFGIFMVLSFLLLQFYVKERR